MLFLPKRRCAERHRSRNYFALPDHKCPGGREHFWLLSSHIVMDENKQKQQKLPNCGGQRCCLANKKWICSSCKGFEVTAFSTKEIEFRQIDSVVPWQSRPVMFGYSIIATILSPSKNKQNQNNQKTNKTNQTKEKHPTTPYKTLEVKTQRLEITSIFPIWTYQLRRLIACTGAMTGFSRSAQQMIPTRQLRPVRWWDFESQPYSIYEEISLTKQKVPGGDDQHVY